MNKKIKELKEDVKKIIKKYGLRLVLDCIEKTEEWGEYQEWIDKQFKKAEGDLKIRKRRKK